MPHKANQTHDNDTHDNAAIVCSGSLPVRPARCHAAPMPPRCTHMRFQTSLFFQLLASSLPAQAALLSSLSSWLLLILPPARSSSPAPASALDALLLL